MVIGISVASFTVLHVIISLIAIAAGFVVMYGLAVNREGRGWTALFLLTIVLTSITGFMFPFTGFGPPHVFGLVSLVALAAVLYARYATRLAGHWRWIYVVGVFLAAYLNVVVGVVQAFGKIGFLHAIAPEQTETPFLLAQIAVLIVFAVTFYLALRRYHPRAAPGIPAD